MNSADAVVREPDTDGSGRPSKERLDRKAPQVSRNVASTIAAQLLTWAMSFAVILYLPAYLGPSGMGKLSLATAFGAVLLAVIPLGTSTVLVKEVSRNHGRAISMLVTSLMVRLPLSALSTALAYGVARLMRLDYETTVLVLVCSGAAVLATVNDAVLSTLQGLERLPRQNAVAVAEKLIWAALTIAAVLTRRPLWEIAMAPWISSTIAAACNLSAFSKDIGSSVRSGARLPRLVDAASMVSIGLPFLGWSLCVAMYGQADPVVIRAVAGRDLDIGWYGVTTKLIGTTLFLPAALTTALLPRLSRLYRQSDLSPQPPPLSGKGEYEPTPNASLKGRESGTHPASFLGSAPDRDNALRARPPETGGEGEGTWSREITESTTINVMAGPPSANRPSRTEETDAECEPTPTPSLKGREPDGQGRMGNVGEGLEKISSEVREQANTCDDFARLARKALSIALLCGIPIAMALGVMPDRVLHMLPYGAKFDGAAPVLRIGGPGLLLWYMGILLGGFVMSRDGQGRMLRVAAVVAVAAIPLCFLVSRLTLSWYGNAAIGAITADCLCELYLVVSYVRMLPRGLIDAGLASLAARCMLASLPMIAVMWVAMANHRGLWSIVPCAVIYLALCRTLRCIEPADLALLRGIVSRRTGERR